MSVYTWVAAFFCGTVEGAPCAAEVLVEGALACGCLALMTLLTVAVSSCCSVAPSCFQSKNNCFSYICCAVFHIG